ncbi:hypothetical protein MEO41_28055, partial [Dolichospermum sp. ST_sed4]|nr:hypothetical protein [Dolichospermum sp. ST_sed4]
MILIIGLGVSMAVTPLVAISIGGGKRDEAQNLFKQSLIVNFAFGIIMTILILIGSELFTYLNQPPLIVKYASSYTKILAISIIPWMIYQSYKQFIEGLSITHPPMVVTIIDAPTITAEKPARRVSLISPIPTALPTRIPPAAEIPVTAIKEIEARL